MTAPAPLWPPAAEEAVRRFGRPDPRLANEGDLVARALRWPATRTPRAARSSLAAISVLIAAVKLPSVIDGSWSDARPLVGYQAFTVGLILLAAIVVRTVTPRHAVAQWILGVFFAGTLVDWLGTTLADHVSGNAYGAVVVPTLEEVAKVLPLVFVMVVAARLGRGMGALDCCVLAAAAGGGFAFYEDMLWQRMFSSGFEGLGVLFPTVLQDPVVAAGHLVWSASVGLGIGVLVKHRRARWAWFAGPLLIAVPLLDHMSINYRGEEYDRFRELMADGWLSVWVLLVGIVVVLLVEMAVVQRSAGADHLFAPVPAAQLFGARPVPVFSARYTPRQVQRLRNEAVWRHHLDRPARPDIVVELARGRATLEVPSVDT